MAILLVYGMGLPAGAQVVPAPPQRAAELSARGQADSALVLLDSAIVANPAHAGLKMTKAGILLDAADTVAAIEALRLVVDAVPTNLEARLRLVRVQLARGEARAARALLDGCPSAQFRRSTDAMYLSGRVYEAMDQPDSAAALYHRAYEHLSTHDFPDLPIAPKQTLAPVQLETTDGAAVEWRAGKQTLFLFWSRDSEQSENALAEILPGVKRAATSWKLIPVNVERALPVPERRAVAAHVKEMGCPDTVRFDPEWQLIRRWSADRLPFAVLVSYHGTVTDVFSGWNETTRRELLDDYLGPLRDSVIVRTPVIDSAKLRGDQLYAQARDLWSRGQTRTAIERLVLAINNQPNDPRFTAQMACYRWQLGDTAGAWLASQAARRADSTDAWARIAGAAIALARSDVGQARSLLSFELAADSPALGVYTLWRTIAAVRAEDLDRAADGLGVCRRDCPYNPYVAVAEALLADRLNPTQAMGAWRRAVEQRMAIPVVLK